MTTNIERRNLVQEFRVSQEGEAPKISGYAALFDTASEPIYGLWTEEIDPHAFDNVLASNPDCRALWNHNPDHVLGRTIANTLALTIDSRGLAYVIDPPNTQLANDLMISMRRKDVTQSSFAFVCKRDQWTDNEDGTATRRILEFEELLDVSPVTYPAYTAATSGVRSLPDSMPTEMRSRFEKRDADGCVCGCPQCGAAACGICSSDPQCVGADRSERSASVDNERLRMEMKLKLLTL
jgi:HK97 family phage prohead protease